MAVGPDRESSIGGHHQQWRRSERVLLAMYKAIGCDLVDIVQLSHGPDLRLDMWLDDEGLHTQRMNPYATRLAQHFGFIWQGYFGRILLCTNVLRDTAVLTGTRLLPSWRSRYWPRVSINFPTAVPS
ncbi:MAG: hypothetical protein QOE58_3478, partial [Actinomycetota bacterium]|nr:hypothetical protein [Actinomycetota bacterium]